MELLQTFEYGSLKVETYYQGNSILPNKVYINNKLVLEDNTFRPSPLHNIDDTETMVSLLGFYTLQPGDIDQDYFDNLNCPELLVWASNDNLDNFEADEIKLMLNDWEQREDTEFLADNEMTFEDCCKIEQYIKTA